MATQANPAVGAPDVELTALDGAEDAPVPAPIATPENAAIGRRSRRDLWRTVTESTQTQAELEAAQAAKAKEAADLTQSEAFRAYQAAADRRLEEARQKAARLETQMQERAEVERRERLEVLEQAMDDEELDPDERRAARNDYIAIATQEYTAQLRQWEDYKRGEIIARGLDPNEPQFNRDYTPGQAGLFEFQADLTAAENAKLRKELDAAKKSVVDPSTLAELVRKEVARLAQAQGLDTVDLGEPAGAAATDDAWERDLAAFQAGRMSPAEYTRRWGRK
jgi:hypothetical protein